MSFPTFRGLLLFLGDLTLIVFFISEVNRNLLLKSGSVEKNPGPNDSYLTFAAWNIDSLLARDGSKKSLV